MTGKPSGTEPSGWITLSKYVQSGGDVALRSSLPDHHPESWPSKFREATGQDIPADWRARLVTTATLRRESWQ